MAITFPAMRGVQARREFYVVMVPLRYLPRLFLFDEEEIPAELRAQRALNKNRLPALVRYIVDNRSDYVFSALTASIDGDMEFDAYAARGHTARLGVLQIGLGARLVINDGQHRRAAIEEALRVDPTLADETIPVVIFADEGLARSQQMFADLNRHAVRPAKSIGILYDHREDDASVARLTVIRSDFFRGIVEMERSTLAAASRKLFTLSALYNATSSLLTGLKFASSEDAAKTAQHYWELVARQFPEWHQVRRGRLPAGDIRKDYIHSHGIALQAMGRVGNTLMHESLEPGSWESRVQLIGTLDWSRANTSLWEGRALIGGRVSKSGNNVTLTTNALRRHLGLPLSPDEQRVEDAYLRGRHD